MLRVCFAVGIVLFLLGFGFAQSLHATRSYPSFLEQTGCPIGVVSSGGSAVVLKNVSDKRIASYVLACFGRKGKKYEIVSEFATSESPIDLGEVFADGGFDATPFNICKGQ